MLARPRVECASSRVTMYDGHIVPSRFLRHSPTPLHISTARAESGVIGEVEERRRRRRRVTGAESQVRGDRRRVDDAAGIEEAVRIERLLHLPERLIELGAEHLLVEGAAHQAVAVLARQRAAELEHEIGDFVGDRFELRDAVRGLEIDDRPDVQAADRGVRVHAGGGVVPPHDAR